MERMFYKSLMTIGGLGFVIDNFLWVLCASVWHTVPNIKFPHTVTCQDTTDVLSSLSWVYNSQSVLSSFVSRRRWQVHWRNLKWTQSKNFISLESIISQRILRWCGITVSRFLCTNDKSWVTMSTHLQRTVFFASFNSFETGSSATAHTILNYGKDEFFVPFFCFSREQTLDAVTNLPYLRFVLIPIFIISDYTSLLIYESENNFYKNLVR